MPEFICANPSDPYDNSTLGDPLNDKNVMVFDFPMFSTVLCVLRSNILKLVKAHRRITSTSIMLVADSKKNELYKKKSTLKLNPTSDEEYRNNITFELEKFCRMVDRQRNQFFTVVEDGVYYKVNDGTAQVNVERLTDKDKITIYKLEVMSDDKRRNVKRTVREASLEDSKDSDSDSDDEDLTKEQALQFNYEESQEHIKILTKVIMAIKNKSKTSKSTPAALQNLAFKELKAYPLLLQMIKNEL